MSTNDDEFIAAQVRRESMGTDDDDAPDNDRHKVYRFTLEVTVHSPEWLQVAARERAIAEGVEPADYDETRAEHGIGYDLQMMLDPGSLPGCDIQHSYAEGIWS